MVEINVYTTETCPHCTRLKRWLDENDYDYNEHQVDKNREKAKEMMQRSGRRGVPQTFIGDNVIIGYQPNKIQQAMQRLAESA
jgi:glutaredoxin-like YruB-family protein